MAKLEDKTNVRRSFETKLVTDDDDDEFDAEIIIVHEEENMEGDGLDDFFVGGQEPTFEQVEEADVKDADVQGAAISHSELAAGSTDKGALGASLNQVENPFKDNLFNSE